MEEKGGEKSSLFLILQIIILMECHEPERSEVCLELLLTSSSGA